MFEIDVVLESDISLLEGSTFGVLEVLGMSKKKNVDYDEDLDDDLDDDEDDLED